MIRTGSSPARIRESSERIKKNIATNVDAADSLAAQSRHSGTPFSAVSGPREQQLNTALTTLITDPTKDLKASHTLEITSAGVHVTETPQFAVVQPQITEKHSVPSTPKQAGPNRNTVGRSALQGMKTLVTSMTLMSAANSLASTVGITAGDRLSDHVDNFLDNVHNSVQDSYIKASKKIKLKFSQNKTLSAVSTSFKKMSTSIHFSNKKLLLTQGSRAASGSFKHLYSFSSSKPASSKTQQAFTDLPLTILQSKIDAEKDAISQQIKENAEKSSTFRGRASSYWADKKEEWGDKFSAFGFNAALIGDMCSISSQLFEGTKSIVLNAKDMALNASPTVLQTIGIIGNSLGGIVSLGGMAIGIKRSVSCFSRSRSLSKMSRGYEQTFQKLEGVKGSDSVATPKAKRLLSIMKEAEQTNSKRGSKLLKFAGMDFLGAAASFASAFLGLSSFVSLAYGGVALGVRSAVDHNVDNSELGKNVKSNSEFLAESVQDILTKVENNQDLTTEDMMVYDLVTKGLGIKKIQDADASRIYRKLRVSESTYTPSQPANQK